MHLIIFDRWGEKVFETSDPKHGWDGYYLDKLMNTGVYVYTITAIIFNGQEVKKNGNVTLVR